MAPRPPTVYRVHARSPRPGEVEADIGTEQIRLDTAWGREPSGAPGPAELLAAAFAACLLKNLERTGQLLRFRYESAEVEVTAQRRDDPPMFTAITYDMRVVTDEPQRRIDLVHRNLRSKGTVFNTLAAVCDVQGTVAAG